MFIGTKKLRGFFYYLCSVFLSLYEGFNLSPGFIACAVIALFVTCYWPEIFRLPVRKAFSSHAHQQGPGNAVSQQHEFLHPRRLLDVPAPCRSKLSN